MAFLLLWQVRKEPKEVAAERKEEARAANAAARKEQQATNEAKKKMKGKNKPSRRQRKKQLNIIEERKGGWPRLLMSSHSLCCKCDMHRPSISLHSATARASSAYEHRHSTGSKEVPSLEFCKQLSAGLLRAGTSAGTCMQGFSSHELA